MTDNGIRDEVAKSMSEMLKSNTTLASLDLGCEEEGKKRKRNERNDERMTDNDIGVEGKKMVRESWGTRGGKLQL